VNDLSSDTETNRLLLTEAELTQKVIALEAQLANAQRQIKLQQQARDLLFKSSKLHSDLKRAAYLQKGILPQEKDLDCLKIEWFYQSSDLLGGDTFDYAKIGNGLYFFCSVDISGHGISAALLSMYIHNYFRNEIRIFKNSIASKYDTNLSNRLLHTIVLINEQMMETLSFVDDYFTTIVGLINTNTNQLELIQAGHPKPYIVDIQTPSESQENVTIVDISGIPIGMIADAAFEVTKHDFPKGSRLVISSDGIFDVFFKPSNKKPPQQFSEQCLVDFLEKSTNLTAKKFILELDEYLQLSNNVHTDDISFLVIDYQ
jgi:sigma-B regulation protein RsbU (phosphoserine phosphatase)